MSRGSSFVHHASVSSRDLARNYRTIRSQPNVALADCFGDWLVAQDYAESTRRDYMRTISSFCAYLGDRSIVDVDHLSVRRFLIQTSKRGLSASGVNHQLCALRGFFDFLYLGGVIDSVSPRMVKGRSYRRTLPRILSEKEIKRLIGATRSLRDRAMVELFYGSGCRIGELTTIRISDIDFSERRIRVLGKSRDRFIFFGEAAKKALQKYIGSRTQGYLFQNDMPTQKGFVGSHGTLWVGQWRNYATVGYGGKQGMILGPIRKMSRQQAEAKFRRLLRRKRIRILSRQMSSRPLNTSAISRSLQIVGIRAGLGRVTSHMLRHSFATHLLDHGADVRLIQELMGHTWLSSTQIYTRVSSARLKEAIVRYHPRGGYS